MFKTLFFKGVNIIIGVVSIDRIHANMFGFQFGVFKFINLIDMDETEHARRNVGNYIIQISKINSDQLIAVRNYFIYLNDCNQIYNLIKTNKYWVDEVNRLLKPLRSKDESKILR